MGKNKRNREFWQSATLNNSTYIQYYNRLMELSMVMFEWKNIPDTIDQRFLELCLFSDGRAIIFKDEVMGFVVMRCNGNGPWDLYNIPKDRVAYASNGYHNQDLNEKNSVLIYNNYIHTTSKLDVEMFARRLYNMDRTIDVNINAQKTPVLLKCSEEQLLTVKNAYKDFDGNMPVIFANDEFNDKSFAVLTTGAPYVADKIRDEKTQTWNEALTYLGISNTNIVKKERMITDEVLRSQGGVIASRYSKLLMRRQACMQLRKLFPEDMKDAWCDYRDDFREADDEFMLPNDSAGGKPTAVVTDLRTNAKVGGGDE